MSENKGLIMAFLAALISGVSVFVNGAAVKLADPLLYTALKNIGALAFLAALVLIFQEMKNFRNLSKKQWGMLVLIGIVGGSVPFLMFFYGLKLGGAAVSSFIFRSLFIFAGIFGYLLLKEQPSQKVLLAGFVMLIGNALLVSGSLSLGFGELLVLGATMLWALEYTISRKVLCDVQPRVVMVSRMLFGSIILLGFICANGSVASITQISSEVLSWLFLTSLLLAGFLSSWYVSLKYLPVLKATSILALGGIITSILDLIFLGKAITLAQGFGLLLILIGAALIANLSSVSRSASGAASVD